MLADYFLIVILAYKRGDTICLDLFLDNFGFKYHDTLAKEKTWSGVLQTFHEKETVEEATKIHLLHLIKRGFLSSQFPILFDRYPTILGKLIDDNNSDKDNKDKSDTVANVEFLLENSFNSIENLANLRGKIPTFFNDENILTLFIRSSNKILEKLQNLLTREEMEKAILMKNKILKTLSRYLLSELVTLILETF